jgi:hypothetical protein
MEKIHILYLYEMAYLALILKEFTHPLHTDSHSWLP